VADELMLDTLHIEANGVPIYVQIRDQILAAIGAGALRPGDRMPTMRQVAVALKVDLNTVRHAYEAARETGAIVLVKARGTFVAETPPSIGVESQVAHIERMAHQTIAIARAGGVDPFLLARRIAEITQGDVQ
jgi:GntR family transcriptional regulator